MGAVVSGDEDHTVTDQLLCGGDCLLGVAEVVHRGALHLLAEDAAGGVDVGHRQRRAALHLPAEPGILARHRPAMPIRTSARAGQPSAAANMTMAPATRRCITSFRNI
jgi:hypothetical protein